MQVCKSRFEMMMYGKRFESRSSDKVYKVTAFRKDQFPFCNCPSYIFQRSKKAKAMGLHQNELAGTCKHLEQALSKTCDWAQKEDSDYVWDMICPKCGDELIEADDNPVYPDDNGASAKADMLALAQELASGTKSAPAPVKQPQVTPVPKGAPKPKRKPKSTSIPNPGSHIEELRAIAADLRK